MKTKEIKKIIENNGYTFSTDKYNERMMIFDEYGTCVMKLLDSTIVKLSDDKWLESTQIKTVTKALIEYSETPIEEREEGKKYCLKTHLRNYRDDEFLYLHKITSSDNLWLIDTPYKRFTQSEIDNFPPEIKGAINCGFLKKIEVEE